jgi:hypothetical protein
LGLAVVRDLRDEARAPAGPEELADFETDVLAGFVLARATAGLADGTIRFTSLASSAWTTKTAIWHLLESAAEQYAATGSARTQGSNPRS